MKAKIEILSGIVRVGERHHAYGDPYEAACGFACSDGRHAVLKGLTSNDEDLSTAHVRAAMQAVAALGMIPVWVRLKNPKRGANDGQGTIKGAARGGKIRSGKQS